MSDARAAAEARRAKILAKNNVRLMMAKGDGVPEGEEIADVKIPRERPLAARRRLVETKASTESEEKTTTSDRAPEAVTETEPSASTDSVDDPQVESISEFAEKLAAKADRKPDEPIAAKSSSKVEPKSTAESAAAAAAASKSTLPTVSTKPASTPDESVSTTTSAASSPRRVKSTRDIEKEIAESTAKFDSNLLTDSKKTAEKKAAAKKPVVVKVVKSIQPHQVMRVIRLIGVLIIGIFMGHRSAKLHAPKISAVMSHYHAHSTGASLSAFVPHSVSSFVTSVNVSSIWSQSFAQPQVAVVSEQQAASSSEGSPSKQTASAAESTSGKGAASASGRSSSSKSPLPLTVLGALEIDPKTLLFVDPSGVPKGKFSTSQPDGTWLGWAGNYLIKQAESTTSAIGLVWWIAGLFSGVVGRICEGAKIDNEKTSIVTKLLNFYASGWDGILEMMLGPLGELALHFIVISAASVGTMNYVIDPSTLLSQAAPEAINSVLSEF